ncbi:MAG: right-handed parallel beta-helix repeat-containing protein [Phycisphaerales bacterium]|nr:right-handed parallel beta-helix repeat-containing protein [Phycisphaerales bacterium]
MNTTRMLPQGAASIALLLLAGTAGAQTIYVDTSADVTDFGGAQQVADLPGPDGKISLAEAGLASDNTPGVQTIGFHIPQSDWQMQWLYPGRAVLQPFLGFRVFETAIIDATTQTAFTGETNPDGGAEVVIFTGSYLIDNVGGAMRGFDHTSISVSGGSGNVIQGNTVVNIEVYDSPSALIGGTNTGEGNTAGTIKLDRTNDCVVIGNTTTRVRVLGWVGGGQPATNNRIGGPTLAERNFITGYGTWSEGCPGGTTVQIFDSIGTVVENNWIGTTPDGMAQGSLASTTGVGLEGENHDTVVRDNRIAGILGHGTGPHCVGWLVGSAITVYGKGSGVLIVGNAIGLNANDEPVLGSVTGITMSNYFEGPVQDVVVGGTGPGEANEIAGHLLTGVRVDNTFSGVRISANSIHDNGDLGIDLVTAGFQTGVTPNDTLDPDVGANGLQNYPVLLAASTSPAGTNVAGTLNALANQSFSLEFFASSACDPSGFGEGAVFLGAMEVTTDAAGDATFSAMLPVVASAGSFVTSTATLLPVGSTSEFSACLPIAVQLLGDLDGSGGIDGADLGALLGAWGPCSGCPADLNGDGAVDGADLGMLLANWG